MITKVSESLLLVESQRGLLRFLGEGVFILLLVFFPEEIFFTSGMGSNLSLNLAAAAAR